jgi:hypothetical protein
MYERGARWPGDGCPVPARYFLRRSRRRAKGKKNWQPGRARADGSPAA